MNPALTEARRPYAVSAPRSEMLLGAAALLVVVACALLGLWRLNPPRAVGADAPPTEFSAARAFKHLETVAARPRPIGSAAHAETREYLLRELSALGLVTEVQKASGVSRRAGTAINAATVENVLARLKGTGAGPSVLLVCHYDSVPTGPGASDDGSAVAALLETARALKAQTPLRNDVIFLFTDAEETGLLGAKAFAEEHAWAKEVGVVLNFDARGHTGQSIMFETSPSNRWLIAQLGAAAQYPVANSLSYEVYKRMPNDTDFSIFKARGFSGLNFAHLEGFTHYHTRLDNLQNLDRHSLQHQGSYALSLTRHFGNLDLGAKRDAENGGGADAVYFNLLGFRFVQYSGALVLPLLLLTLCLLGAVIYLGLRSGRLTLAGSAVGFLTFLAALVLAPLLLTAVWRAFVALQKSLGGDEQAVAYQQNLFLLGFVALSVATAAMLPALLRRKIRVPDMFVGALLWWAVPAILTSILSPGASYLFVWPLLFGLLPLAFLFRAKSWEPSRPAPLLALTVCALPGVFLLTPTIYLLFTALGFGALAAVGVLVVMLSGLLIPQLSVLTATRRRLLLPAVAALTGLILISAGGLTRGFDDTHPRSDNLFYALDADAGRAIWASADATPDEWTAQFLTGAKRGAITEFIPQQSDQILSSAAPVLALAPPHVELLSDTTADELRSLRLRVTSPRGAPVMTVYMDSDTPVQAAALNGKPLDEGDARRDNSQARWRMSYYAPPAEGVELTLTVKPSAPFKLRVMDRTYGLPEIPGASPAARPAWLMPSARQLYSDQMLVNKSFTF